MFKVYGEDVETMTPNEIALFVLAGLLGLFGWYVGTHSEEKPRYKKPRRCPKCGTRF